jgi:PAS domain S-box-containing protein
VARDLVWSAAVRAVAAGFHSEFRIRWPDGAVRHLQCDGIVQRDASGRSIRMRGTHLDLTEARAAAERLRQSERALRESEERLRSAFESAGIGMALISPDGRWLRGNRTLGTMLGLGEIELTGRAVRDLTHPEDVAQDEAISRAVLDGNLRTVQRSKRFFGQQCEVIWTLVTMALVRDAEGQPLHFVGLFGDITQRRDTERRVKTLNDQLRGALRFTPSLKMLFDREGRYLIATRSLELALGKPAAEIVGKRIEDVSLFRIARRPDHPVIRTGSRLCARGGRGFRRPGRN